MSALSHHNAAKMVSNHHVEEMLDIRKILGAVCRYWWFIALGAFIGVSIAFLCTLRLQPQYNTTASIQISAAENNAAAALGYFSKTLTLVDSELALIRTRYILEPIAKKYALNIIVTPQYYPVFGEWFSSFYHGAGFTKPFLGLSQYAWGDEKVAIKQFIIPTTLRSQTFQLIAGENSTYQLATLDGHVLLTGTAGLVATSDQIPGLLLQVSQLQARIGMHFILSYQDPATAANNLADSLQLETDGTTGIVRLHLRGTDPKQIVKVLNAIVVAAVQDSLMERKQEAEKMLIFLNERLPTLKISLDKAEMALSQYREKAGSFNIAGSSQMLLQQARDIKTKLENLQSQQQELLQNYTSVHPLVLAAKRKQVELQKQLAELEATIKKSPMMTQWENNLSRDVNIKNGLYVSLLTKRQQLEITQAGIVGDLHRLEAASPAAQIPMEKLRKWLMGLAMGACLSVLMVLLKSFYSKTIEDPFALEDELGIPVQAIVPYSKQQRRLEKKGSFPASLPVVLASQCPDDNTIESLRSLRVSMHLMPAGGEHRVIAVMGGGGDIGKSFISLNLSHVIVDSGKKTLLIDGDLRKGALHTPLLQSKFKGLSGYLEGKYTLDEVICPIQDNFSFIARGNVPRDALRLFQSQKFQDLLQIVKEHYELVVIDTPSILGVSDAILIAKYCDVKLFVVNAVSENLRDVKIAVKKFKNHGIDIDALVVNCRNQAGYYGSHYAYSAYDYIYGAND